MGVKIQKYSKKKKKLNRTIIFATIFAVANFPFTFYQTAKDLFSLTVKPRSFTRALENL